ncbi:MAG TPA: hypothetical protein VG408_01620 [Actinomycetota bacterium]|nr:hypothetical protein [Actinomycetota bacterium]
MLAPDRPRRGWGTILIGFVLGMILVPIGVVLAPLGIGIPIFAIGMALLLPDL